MKLKGLDFKVVKNNKKVAFEIVGFDVWESFSKKESIKIVWFIIKNVIIKRN